MTDDDKWTRDFRAETVAEATINGNPYGNLSWANARIRELEAELESRHSTIRNLQQTIEACGACVEWWQRIVDDKTHVIVPVEPTEKMVKAGWQAKDRMASLAPNIEGIYRAMIRAAQPGASD